MAEMRTCAHCGMNFKPRFFLAIKLGTKRLERCPHCHKFTDVYAAPKAAATTGPAAFEVSEEESLRRRIEDSKGDSR